MLISRIIKYEINKIIQLIYTLHLNNKSGNNGHKIIVQIGHQDIQDQFLLNYNFLLY